MTVQDPTEPRDPTPLEQVPTPGALQALLAHWMHEDNLFWSQVRTMLVIQGTAIAAAVALFPSLLYLPPLLLGLVGTNVIHNLAIKIRQNRDINLFAIKTLSKHLFGDEVSAKIELDHESTGRRAVFDTYGPLALAVHSLRADGDDAGAGHQRWIFGLSYFTTLFVATTMLWMSANGCSSKECALSGFSSIGAISVVCDANVSGPRRPTQ